MTSFPLIACGEGRSKIGYNIVLQVELHDNRHMAASHALDAARQRVPDPAAL